MSDILQPAFCQTPCYMQPGLSLYNVNCLDLIDTMPIADVVITDPPYPNNAGHFIEGIQDAIFFMQNYKCNHWFIFWDEMTKPPIDLPLVAIHIWHRSNTNRPDNYEPIYEYNIDGIKKASRVAYNVSSIAAVAELELQNFKLRTNEQ